MTGRAFDIDEIMAEVFASGKASPPATTATLRQNGANCRKVAIVATPPASKNSATVINIAAHFAKAQRLADAKNTEAAWQRHTDKFCRCGRLAPHAWLISGREIWRCTDCESTND